eukprot:scaffold199493_cov18-Tisochrysis_lutea.AAC.1
MQVPHLTALPPHTRMRSMSPMILTLMWMTKGLVGWQMMWSDTPDIYIDVEDERVSGVADDVE